MTSDLLQASSNWHISSLLWTWFEPKGICEVVYSFVKAFDQNNWALWETKFDKEEWMVIMNEIY